MESIIEILVNSGVITTPATAILVAWIYYLMKQVKHERERFDEKDRALHEGVQTLNKLSTSILLLKEKITGS